ncbi:MAG: hypothetical protein J6I49_03175 [Bacteroidales bacterium]|nr:hypothetical protein [Bacteroidales bacterium]
METNITRTSLLWVVVMAGFAMHILADLLPAFWGAPIAMPDAPGEAPTGMLLLMCAFSFTIPLLGLLCTHYRAVRAMRVANLVLASVMLLFNIFHASELFMEFNPVQLLIHPAMVVISVYLLVFSLRMVKQK